MRLDDERITHENEIMRCDGAKMRLDDVIKRHAEDKIRCDDVKMSLDNESTIEDEKTSCEDMMSSSVCKIGCTDHNMCVENGHHNDKNQNYVDNVPYAVITKPSQNHSVSAGRAIVDVKAHQACQTNMEQSMVNIPKSASGEFCKVAMEDETIIHLSCCGRHESNPNGRMCDICTQGRSLRRSKRHSTTQRGVTPTTHGDNPLEGYVVITIIDTHSLVVSSVRVSHPVLKQVTPTDRPPPIVSTVL